MKPKPLRLKDIPGELITIAEFATLTRVSSRYAYELARTGAIPTTRIGARVFVPRAYVEQVCGVAPEPRLRLAG